jgi:large subunit ribosomal protein L7/L12
VDGDGVGSAPEAIMFEAVITAVVVVMGLIIVATQSRLGSLERRLRRLESGAYGPNPSPRLDALGTPSPDIEALILRGEKIEAIRTYREQTGVGLKEAKDAVEDMQRRLGVG